MIRWLKALEESKGPYFAKGYRWGRKGSPPSKNPYARKTTMRLEWGRGWEAGRASRVKANT